MNLSTYGPSYESSIDGPRLRKQHEEIKALCLDGQWRTLFEISQELHFPEASVSSQLRHCRKEQFGSYIVEKQRRGMGGLWEYRILRPQPKEFIQQNLF